MADPEMIKITDLILKGSVAQVPISVRGSLENGKLGDLSGCVKLNETLEELLGNLGVDFKKAAQFLNKIVGDVRIDSLSFGYRNVGPKFVQFVATMQVGKNVYRFVVIKMTGQDGFIVGLDLKWDKELFSGNILSGLVGEISLGDLGVYYASQDFQNIRYDPDQDFQDIDGIALPLPSIKGRNFNKGLNLTVQISVGRINLFDWLEKSNGGDTGPSVQKLPGTGNRVNKDNNEELPTKLTTRWVKIDKSVGPLFVKRVGLSYKAPDVAIQLDAGVDLSCIRLTLLGFGLRYPLNEITTDVREILKNLKFVLDGASVVLDMGPVCIAGGLLKVNDEPLQLDGSLMIRVGDLTIGALGSYADINGTPSLFVFAALQKALGGPPYFFVTGLAFGFGINRALTLPPISDVHNFPLVKAATDPAYLGKELDLRGISLKLSCYISPSPGNFWMAAGLKFTSFGIINAFALATVSIGTQFQVALLGLAKITVPPQPPGAPEIKPIASAELALKVAFSPESGLLAFEARLTENSYILCKEFNLRGGGAFYLWFAGEHAGDFVFSLGGYHPRFQPPVHYPTPDLVEFNCKLGDNVTIQGYCYFALCPSAIMTGGGLNIVYQFGGVRAWFIAYADFLIQWKPLYYDVAIGISVGVALHLKVGLIRVNLSVELSASVNLYGPPLGGIARISLFIITVTVKFGTAKSVPKPLLWESDDPEKSFAKSFLPNPDVTRISIADGLLKENQSEDTTKTTRFVNPHKLVLKCRSLVPATEVRFNDKLISNDENGQPTKLGIRPMDKKSFYSLIDIEFKPDGNDENKDTAGEYLRRYIKISPITKSVPIALWGTDTLNTHTPPDNQMIDNVLVGLKIETKVGPRPWETPPMDMKVLAYQRYQKNFNWSGIKPREALPAFGDKTISTTINADKVVKLRTDILDTLKNKGRKIMEAKDIDLSQLEQNSQYIFQAMPAMARIGQYPPRGYLEI